MRKRKKVRNGVRKGELSFKNEGGISFTLRDSCVPSRLEAAEFAVFCDRGFGFRNGIGERLLQKAVAFGVFCVPKPL